MSSSSTRIQDQNSVNRASVVPLLDDPTKNGLVICNPDGSKLGPFLKLDQTTPQVIINGIPLLTGLTPSNDYDIATKKYVDDSVSGENFWDRTGTTLVTHTAGDSLQIDGDSQFGKSGILYNFTVSTGGVSFTAEASGKINAGDLFLTDNEAKLYLGTNAGDSNPMAYIGMPGYGGALTIKSNNRGTGGIIVETGADILNTLPADGQFIINGAAQIQTDGTLNINTTTTTTGVIGGNFSLTNTHTQGTTTYGLKNDWVSTTAITGGANTAYGFYNVLTKTGADSTASDTNLYASYNIASYTGGNDIGTVRNTYGGYFSATGDTAGTTTTYGIYASATGGDTNYAGYFSGNLEATGTGTFGGTSSGQSIIASGLVVNEDGGNGVADDFRVETVSNANAFVVDASADQVIANVDLILNDVPADTDNTVLILKAGVVSQDEIDPECWGDLSNTYVPYSGANANIDIGDYDFATTDLDVSGDSTLHLTADTDNTVVIQNSSGILKTDEIDSRVWGSTLADDTDLANYVPYTGATTNVALGTHNLTVGGNVVIGDTTPANVANALTIANNSANYATIFVRNDYTGGAGYAGITYGSPSNDVRVFTGYKESTGEFRFNNIKSGGTINFMLGTSKMLIKGDYIGIGTESPATKLEILGTTTQLRLTHTDGVDEADFFVNSDGDLQITPTSRTLYLGDGTAGDSILGFFGNTSVYTLIHDDSEGTLNISANDTTNYASFAEDGEFTLKGNARVYKNQWINVQGLKAPGTKPALLVDWGISCGWEFSNGTDDTICTSIRIPQDMDKTVAPELKIGFASDTNTGDVVWQLEYLYLSQNEDTTAAAQETLTTTQTISTTTDGLTIATITGMDLPSSTDQLIKMRIKRLGADGSDTLADDCVLVGCGMKYVADKLGIAI